MCVLCGEPGFRAGPRTGDIEVILKASHAWGADCVKRFYGMVAFALLARDAEALDCAAEISNCRAILAEGTSPTCS